MNKHAAKIEPVRIGPIGFWIPVPGGIVSKKNNLRPGGRGRGLHYDSGTKQILDGMVFAARGEWSGRPRLTDVEIKLHFGISWRGVDLDNWATSTLDVLVKAGVLRNDSAKHIRKNNGHTFELVPKFSEGVNVTVSGVEA